jgi:hypothetical protein
MARVYADVNQQMPRAYWDYDSVNISWGILENYEVVRKIGRSEHYAAEWTRYTGRTLLLMRGHVYRSREILGSL